MNLARQTISATAPAQIIDVCFDSDSHIFTCSTPAGFAVYRSWPLTLLKKRETGDGTLAMVVPLHSTSMLFLVGGGRSPLYPPNKVVFWDDAQNKEVAELEFRERVRGIACRREWLAVALRRRVVLFKFTDTIQRIQDWDTADNPKGLVSMSTAPYSTLLVLPGRQTGHIHLVQLEPCPPPPPSLNPDAFAPKPPPRQGHRKPPLVNPIRAHENALTSITASPTGRYVATSSSHGTLIRIREASTGNKVYEFRRGADQADIYGVAFRPDEKECAVWSDKGTIHVFSLDSEASNRTSSFQPFAGFLSYAGSKWSYAQFRLPAAPAHVALSTTSTTSRSGVANPDAGDQERCVVAWIEAPVTRPGPSPRTGSQTVTSSPRSISRSLASTSTQPMTPSVSTTPNYQLIALTYAGGWYRLSLPGSSSDASIESKPSSNKSTRSQSTQGSPSSRRHSDRRDSSSASDKQTSTCKLEEFRRFGRWDGWQ